MKPLDRQIVLIGALLVALLGVTLWSWSTVSAARRQAALAAEDARTATILASRVAASRGRPSLAAAERPNLELTSRIEKAAADLPGGAVERIGVEQQRRLGDDASERSRQLVLRDVRLPQLADFLQKLIAAAGDLRVSSLRLTAPRGGEAGDRWTAEIVVAYTVVEPAGATPR